MPRQFSTEGPYDPAPVYSDVMLGDIGSLTPPDPQLAQDIRDVVADLRRMLPHLSPGEPEMAAFQFACACDAVQVSRDAITYTIPIVMMRTTDGPLPFSDEELDDPDFEPDVPYVIDGQLVFARDQHLVISGTYNADVIFSVLVSHPEQPYVLSIFLEGTTVQYMRTDTEFCEHCGGMDHTAHELEDTGDEPDDMEGGEFDAIIRNAFGASALPEASYVSEEAAVIFLETAFWFLVQVTELRNRFLS